MSLSENAYVRVVRQLRTRAFRQKTGQVIVEGLAEVQRAIAASIPIKYLFICPDIIDFNASSVEADEIFVVSKETFAQMAFGSRLKGILAVCQPQILSLSDLKLSKTPFILILEAVEKPGNLGAVIRSADGAGVDAIFVVNPKTDIYNQHVVRSSIGTLFSVPVLSLEQKEAYSFLREQHIRVCVATAKTEKMYTEMDLKSASAVVVGNEHDGVSDFWVNQADASIKIPMRGVGGCLNVTVSASIVMYEALRQRTCATGPYPSGPS